MLTYLFLIALLLFASYFERTKRLGTIIFIIFFVLCFFRGIKVGIDTGAYYLNDITEGLFDGFSLVSYNYEVTFLAFRHFLQDHHLPSRYCLFGLAIITYFFYYRSCKRFNTNLVLFCLFFYLLNFFFHSMNIARQITGAAIILYAYSFLDKKNHYFFFPLVLFAATIHFSSIYSIVLYFIRFLPNLSFGKNDIIVYFAFTALFLITPFIGDYVYSTILGNVWMVDAYGHIVEDTEVSSKSILVYAIEYVNLMVCVRVLIWLQKSGTNKIVSNLFLVSLILETLVGTLSGNIPRMLIDIYSIRIVGFSYFFAKMSLNRIDEKLILFSVYVLLNMYLINSAVFQGTYGVYPYYMTLSLH